MNNEIDRLVTKILNKYKILLKNGKYDKWELTKEIGKKLLRIKGKCNYCIYKGRGQACLSSFCEDGIADYLDAIITKKE